MAGLGLVSDVPDIQALLAWLEGRPRERFGIVLTHVQELLSAPAEEQHGFLDLLDNILHVSSSADSSAGSSVCTAGVDRPLFVMTPPFLIVIARVNFTMKAWLSPMRKKSASAKQYVCICLHRKRASCDLVCSHPTSCKWSWFVMSHSLASHI